MEPLQVHLGQPAELFADSQGVKCCMNSGGGRMPLHERLPRAEVDCRFPRHLHNISENRQSVGTQIVQIRLVKICR